jgi:hypothetical protein
MGRGLAMSVRTALYLPAFVLAIALLIIIAGCGAVVVLVCRGRPSGFSYLDGGT